MPLAPTEEMLDEARASLPELPAVREARYADRARAAGGARPAALLRRRPRRVFEAAVASGDATRAAPGQLDHRLSRPPARSTPASLAKLVAMVEQGTITNQAGREVLAKLVAEGGDPAEIVEREGLGRVEDSGELEAIVEAAIEAASRRGREGQGRHRPGDRARSSAT